MANYQTLYARMVDASERAISEIERQNYGVAREILIAAEQECEELYINEEQIKKQPYGCFLLLNIACLKSQ